MNQVADIELIARTALALVFISSSIGKFIGRTGRMDLALAVVEAVFGLAIAVGIDRQLTAPVGVGVTAAYLVYSATRPPAHSCACFGSRLPRTDASGMRLRNAGLLLVAIVWTTVAWTAGGTTPQLPVVDFAVGLSVAGIIVAGPWAVRWALVNE